MLDFVQIMHLCRLLRKSGEVLPGSVPKMTEDQGHTLILIVLTALEVCSSLKAS